MAQLQVSLLGAFELADGDGRDVRIETRKARALFAILVMAQGQPMRREQLADLLWSRVGTRQSLASLSQAIYSLNRALAAVAPDVIAAELDTVAVDHTRLTVDVWSLEAAACEDSEAGQRRCLEFYGGAFLDNLPIDSETGYTEWRAAERARIEGIVADAGTALMTRWERSPESAEMALVDRLMSIDPYNEPAVRVRMMLLARDGRPAAAIEAGQAFSELLSSELGIAPSQDLAALSARIRAGDIARSSRRPDVSVPSARARRVAALSIAALACLAALLVWAPFARNPMSGADGIRLLVRPFEAGDGVQPDLAQGFSDDLATALVRRATLDVLSRESGRLIPDADDAASGASHVLRGRMRAEADLWVLNLWITETGSGREVWADRIRGGADAPRVVRDQIVARISDGIGAALSPVPDAAPIALPDDAVPAYLRALARLHAGTPEGNADAITPLKELAEAHPEAVEPVGALVLAFERIAFEADDFARAAGLHWREGYLKLKRELATRETAHPDLLAARARLALRRLDHMAAQSLARRALSLEAAHVAALEVLAASLALTGETEAARNIATRAITLSPAATQGGYTALALAAFADGDIAAAAEATEAALDTVRGRPLQLIALRAAILGLESDEPRARAAFGDLVAAVESRPFGAWRIGDVAFTNPRATTWRRPSGAEASSLIRYMDPATDARFREGLIAASGETGPTDAVPDAAPLSGAEIEDLLFDRRILGRQTWLVQHDWSQTRAADGAFFQDSAFGPLPGAREGQSHVIDGRLCDRWIWDATEIESCHLVLRTDADGSHALIGETGRFPFRIAAPAPSFDQ